MSSFAKLFKQSATYNLGRLLAKQLEEFFEADHCSQYNTRTQGKSAKLHPPTLSAVLKLIAMGRLNWKHIIDQCSRFAVDSLPITLSIVGMTCIIIAMQVAPEMVKQGGEKYVGALMAITITRELGAIMSGFR